MNRLLDALEEDLEILKRRLEKSGARHFAVARFDAVDHICQTCFRELESESTAIDSDEDRVLARVALVNEELDIIASEYPELGDWESRPKRTRERTKLLVSEMRGRAGFTKDHHAALGAPYSHVVSTSIRSKNADEPEEFETPSAEVDDDAPLALSGVFTRRRPSR